VFWFKCRPERDVLYTCYESWFVTHRVRAYIEYRFTNPQFREEITDKYLEERALYRASGQTTKQRRLHSFREWKADQSKETKEQH
jgi:hypothetical protein